ncbi:glycosyltransferase family 2 protein [Sphaerospermopsis aphanizomenoides BCCUSP55]|uniref:glycosyltransferase family 2 protein n=1 Tax=Sphaerospermopsis aphanizomenoides TaxID=459663 RepID=UPI001905370A|nr:glycosyltransferase family 2 protein [Sphaerospermopsis aphanizomenoides]MBK1986704.1 glycosyltransferase family 2 protein [Sphaerospermopsis aphanizomenoides BCCUSP55]
MAINSQLSAPLVSVIIPTYNRQEYLKEAIASAVKQTYQNIEIIVSDNCSSENPQSLVESFGDSRIKFWRHPENVGMLNNQMNAFQMARGKYVASLHDDDIWNPDFLAKLVPQLEANSDLILAFCDHYIINSQGEINAAITEENTRFYQRDKLASGIYQDFIKIGLVDKSIPTAAACVIRNGLIDWNSIPLEVGGMWDLYLTYLCCISGYSIYYCSEKLTRYRNHDQTDTNISGSRNVQAKIRKATSEIFCYQIFMKDSRLQHFHAHFKKLWLEANTTLGIGLLRDQQKKAARSYFWSALNEQKFNSRTLIALTLSYTPQILTNKLLG